MRLNSSARKYALSHRHTHTRAPDRVRSHAPHKIVLWNIQFKNKEWTIKSAQKLCITAPSGLFRKLLRTNSCMYIVHSGHGTYICTLYVYIFQLIHAVFLRTLTAKCYKKIKTNKQTCSLFVMVRSFTRSLIQTATRWILYTLNMHRNIVLMIHNII